EAGPYVESAPVRPLSVYGRSKLEGEERLRAEVPGHLILRTTTVYGPETQGKNFVYQVVANARQKKAMRVPSDQLATPAYGPDIPRPPTALVEEGARGPSPLAGPAFVDRVPFGRRACEVFGLDASIIVPVTTAELGQPARRPLKGGLRSEKIACSIR